MKKKILFILPGLDYGGTEHFILDLVTHFQSNYKFFIISLSSNKPLEKKFKELNCDVFTLPSKSFKEKFAFVSRFIKTINSVDPGIIQSFLYKADLFTVFLFRNKLRNRIIWSVRHDRLYNRSIIKKLIIPILLAKISKYIPSKICFNSKASMAWHQSLGYPEKKCEFITNPLPIWIKNVEPNYAARRMSSNLDQLNMTIGMSSRFSRDKGHHLLLDSLKDIRLSSFRIYLSFCGLGTESDGLLQKYIELNFPETSSSCTFNGYLSKEDYVNWHKKIDIFILPSLHEGFPNSLLAAVALNTPSLSTKTGDVQNMLLFNQFKSECTSSDLASKIFYLIKNYEESLPKFKFLSIISRSRYDNKVIYEKYEQLWHRYFE